MNARQRWLVIAYALLVCYLCLWIPWHITAQGQQMKLDYGWVWDGPKNTDSHRASFAQPDLPRIGLRVAAVTAATVAAWLLLALNSRER